MVKEARLRYSNEVVVPLLRGVALVRRLYPWSPVRVYRSSDYTVNVLVVDLVSRQWVLALYVTMQRKPVTPSDVRRMRRLLLSRVNRYSLAWSRDVSMYILAPRAARVTRGAWAEAASGRVVVVRSVSALVRMLLRFLRARAEGLAGRLRDGAGLDSDPALWRLASTTAAVYAALAGMLGDMEVRALLTDIISLGSASAYKTLVSMLARVAA